MWTSDRKSDVKLQLVWTSPRICGRPAFAGHSRHVHRCKSRPYHLIALSIGGAPDDPSNLWPQPRDGEWNAEKKDQLEFVLYKMVCDNQIKLIDAQHDIASDWITDRHHGVPDPSREGVSITHDRLLRLPGYQLVHRHASRRRPGEHYVGCCHRDGGQLR
jgi:hypothetical protein